MEISGKMSEIHNKKNEVSSLPPYFQQPIFEMFFSPNMTYCLVILISQQEEKLQNINLLRNKKSYVCENDQVKSSIWWKENFENLHIEKHSLASFFYFLALCFPLLFLC